MNRFKIFLCSAIILINLAFLPGGRAETITDASVRVLLTKANLTDRADLSLDGLYSVNSVYFQRGSHVTAAFRDGRICLYYEGMSMDCGTEVTFVRHSDPDSQENGIRFDGKYALHPGSLTLSVSEGRLTPVLKINIEDYLWGVVPYEMSDSYPIEALKAQAVAARTYAFKKKQVSSGPYDLVDNTNDQSYNGVLADHTRSLLAIRATEGLCAFDGEDFLISCYYSASNGGQTELVSHVWGGADPDYLITKEDPYDFENPGSTVRSFTIYKDYERNAQALKTRLAESIRNMTADEDTVNVTIESISSLRLMNPLYAGSKIMTSAEFTLLCKGITAPEAEEEIYIEDAFAVVEIPETKPIKVSLPIFPEIESLCNLNINAGSNNEIISVTESGDAFVLSGRRFGHGVGMSQRGAQRMADHYQWTLDQIWEFYYPGTAIKPAVYRNTPAPESTVGMSFLSTPGPAATPTPRPTLMPIEKSLEETSEVFIVDKISTGSYLNLRSEPNTAAFVLRQLYYGQKLILVEDIDEFWIRVKTDGCEGYVMKEFVSRAEE